MFILRRFSFRVPDRWNSGVGRGCSTPILGQYGYVPRELPPHTHTHLWSWQLLKTVLFRPIQPIQLEKILFFKNIYASLLFFSKHLFHVWASSESPPPTFSARGRSLYLNPPWQIYTTSIFEYPPPPGWYCWLYYLSTHGMVLLAILFEYPRDGIAGYII